MSGLGLTFLRRGGQAHPTAGSDYIRFADQAVFDILMSKGISSDGVGITKDDAAAVTSFASDLLRNNTIATSFNEIKYFTGLTKIAGGTFYKATNLVIEELDNPALNFIGFGAFNSTKIRKITRLAPETTIESEGSGFGGAFENCTELTELSQEAGQSLAAVGASAFRGSALQGTIDLSSVVRISSNAFRGSQNISKVIIGGRCEIIGDGAFFNCVNAEIDDLNLPNLKNLYYGAFNGTRLKKITSLGSITTFSNAAGGVGGLFENCKELTDISQDVLNKITKLGDATFVNCSNLRIDLILPSLTGTITSAFAKCPIQRILNLGEITNLFSDSVLLRNTYPFGSEYTLMILPSTLARIGRYAFAGDGNLQALIIKAITPPSLASYAFSESKSTCPVYVPDASVSAYQTATGWTAWASRIRGISQLATDNPTLYAEIQQYL